MAGPSHAALIYCHVGFMECIVVVATEEKEAHHQTTLFS